MEFYNTLNKFKEDNKLSNKELGELINMKPDTFRMAIKRKSLSELEKNELIKHINRTNKNLNEPEAEYKIVSEKNQLQTEIDNLKELLLSKKELIEALKKNIETKDLVIKSLNTQIESLNEIIKKAS